MTTRECLHEGDVVEAVLAGRWPAPELCEHAAGCEVCRDAARIATSFASERMPAPVPDAGRVLWLAQVRARREAVAAAARPIAVVEVVASGVVLGLVGLWGGWIAFAAVALVVLPAALLFALADNS